MSDFMSIKTKLRDLVDFTTFCFLHQHERLLLTIDFEWHAERQQYRYATQWHPRKANFVNWWSLCHVAYKPTSRQNHQHTAFRSVQASLETHCRIVMGTSNLCKHKWNSTDNKFPKYRVSWWIYPKTSTTNWGQMSTQMQNRCLKWRRASHISQQRKLPKMRHFARYRISWRIRTGWSKSLPWT